VEADRDVQLLAGPPERIVIGVVPRPLVVDVRAQEDGPEQILEAYYRVAVFSFAHFAFDYQFINHPAYRGPVSVFALQLHLQ
jgi:hypothetical protein